MLAQIYNIAANPAVGSVLGVFGAFGVVFTIYSHFSNRKIAKLSFEKYEFPVIGDEQASVGGQLKIIYGEELVPRVTISHFIIWNSGSTTIHGSDIVQIDMLRIQIPNDKIILKASAIKSTRSEISAKIEKSQTNFAIVDFDFLDPNDGMAVEVIHTGLVSDANLTGTIKGIPNGAQRYSEDNFIDRFFKRHTSEPEKIKTLISNIGFGLLATIISLMIGSDLVAVSLGYDPVFHNEDKLTYPELLKLLLFGPIVLFGLILFRPRRLGYPSKLNVRLKTDTLIGD